MKADIELYESSADQYDKLQMLRPDYATAKLIFLKLALNFLRNKKDMVLADFCSGTGINTKLLTSKLHVSKAILIDINQQFIEIAKSSGINASLELVVGDILDASLKPVADAVISMFAYHHVPDNRKRDYLEKVKQVLKKDGLLFLGEIYSPDKYTTLRYYDFLLSCIKPELRTPELKKFLRQTAESDDFEYKVSKQFAKDQLEGAGFSLIESHKVWPLEMLPEGVVLPKDVGTFIEVWKFSEIV